MHMRETHRRRIGLLASLLLFLGLPAGVGAYSFDQTSVSSGTDFARYERINDQKFLLGKCDGTSYSIVLDQDKFHGMGSHVLGIHYGSSTRYVWVYTHNRCIDGNTLIDVSTGESIFGAKGNGSNLSPDNKRIAYFQGACYGLLSQVCINEFAVYPDLYQQCHPEQLSDNTCAPENKTEMPRSEMVFYPEWISNETFIFLVAEHIREADLLDNPKIKQHWFVRVDGAGDGLTTATLRVRRAPLNDEETIHLNQLMTRLQTAHNDEARVSAVQQLKTWQAADLPKAIHARLVPVTKNSFASDLLADVVPQFLLGFDPISPGGSHKLNVFADGDYTDTQSKVGVKVDDRYDLDLGLGNVSRLVSTPVWIDDTHAQLQVQTGWVEEQLLGPPHRSKTWTVTLSMDNNTTPTVHRQINGY